MIVQGMHGLGDNIHQRAIIRQLLQNKEQVWLETPWPSVYHDLMGPRLNLVKKDSGLRTQQKNIVRQAEKFSRAAPPPNQSAMRIWYRQSDVKQYGTFLGAMAAYCSLQPASFALPIPPAWRRKAQRWLHIWRPNKPLMIYRPLVERTEWNGCASRNPDAQEYARLAELAAPDFFVISIADLEKDKEWMSSKPLRADAEMHHGELDFETIAALMSMAALVFCSPGFALILAQAVRAPLVAVFGGHEAARFYDHGFAENLFIQPRRPCECFNKNHRCDKRIAWPDAQIRLKEFINENCTQSRIHSTSDHSPVFDRRVTNKIL